MEQAGKWAAIVPICGGGDPAAAKKIKDVPTWVFHGDDDKAVKVDYSRAMVEALKKAGGMPKYTAHGPKGPINLQDHGNPVRRGVGLDRGAIDRRGNGLDMIGGPFCGVLGSCAAAAKRHAKPDGHGGLRQAHRPTAGSCIA